MATTEKQIALKQLDIHLLSTLACASLANVSDSRYGGKMDLPAGRGKPVAKVDLFEIHEE